MRKFVWLMLVGFVFSAGYGNAQPAYTIWSGTFSCPVKFTQTVEDLSGNTRFKSFTESFQGEIRLFLGEEGPVQNEKGNFLEVLDDEANLLFAFDRLTGIRTDIKKSKTDRVLMIATGDYYPDPEDHPGEVGIAYLNVNGILKKSTSGEVTSIGVTFELGGGFYPLYIFGCNFRTTLRETK